ncbi:MAG: type IV secretion protein IcmC [Legionellales bacterium]
MNTDLVTILSNLSQSLGPVQHLITGGAYLMGLFFVFSALTKFYKMASSGHSSQEKLMSPILYLVIGAALVFLPTALQVANNTVFGVGNVLSYTPTTGTTSIYASMSPLIHTAGILWFVRGCSLIVHAGDAGEHHGPKGLAFLCAGIFAMNFEATVSSLNSSLSYFVSATMSFKSSVGF